MGSWMALAMQGCPKPIVWWWVVLHGTTRCQNSLGMFGPKPVGNQRPIHFQPAMQASVKAVSQRSKRGSKSWNRGSAFVSITLSINHSEITLALNPLAFKYHPYVVSRTNVFHWKTFLGAVEFHPSLPIHKIIKHFVHRFCITSRCVTKDLEVQKHTP